MNERGTRRLQVSFSETAVPTPYDLHLIYTGTGLIPKSGDSKCIIG